MQEIIPNLWIGDFTASQNREILRQNDIRNVVAAMRQQYTPLEEMALLRIPVDDNPSANLITHFPTSNAFIDAALQKGNGVLVHCQAGVSRSTTIVAAFLMANLNLTVEQAIATVKGVRSQVEPTDTFLHQLEMYERCNCEWDPVKWSEERRFLMNLAMDGPASSIVLAYYPSPAPSPRPRSGSDLKGLTTLDPLTPLTPAEIPSETSQILPARKPSAERLKETAVPILAQPQPTAPSRKRLTARGTGAVVGGGGLGGGADLNQSLAPLSTQGKSPGKQMKNIGSKAEVTIVGKRIRCKMCRRELAAREHILVHEPGAGQQAFAPHRRDMAAHRAEMEARRRDAIAKEELEARQMKESKRNTDEAELNADMLANDDDTSESKQGPSVPNLDDLSLDKNPAPQSNPSASGIPSGLRMATPRYATVRPPVRPPVRQLAKSADGENSAAVQKPSDGEGSVTPVKPSLIDSQQEGEPTADERQQQAHHEERAASYHEAPLSPELPLLPSHLCSSYFVEPLSWMSPLLENGALAGKLVCPAKKCGAKLGSFDWAGQQCSCGAWVCPGFAINVSKVDEVHGSA